VIVAVSQNREVLLLRGTWDTVGAQPYKYGHVSPGKFSLILVRSNRTELEVQPDRETLQSKAARASTSIHRLLVV